MMDNEQLEADQIQQEAARASQEMLQQSAEQAHESNANAVAEAVLVPEGPDAGRVADSELAHGAAIRSHAKRSRAADLREEASTQLDQFLTKNIVWKDEVIKHNATLFMGDENDRAAEAIEKQVIDEAMPDAEQKKENDHEVALATNELRSKAAQEWQESKRLKAGDRHTTVITRDPENPNISNVSRTNNWEIAANKSSAAVDASEQADRTEAAIRARQNNDQKAA